MALDRNAFIDHFLEEAAENLAAIEAGILALKQDPGNQAELVVLLRELHTLKGSARMLRFPCLESVCHGLETVFKGVKDGRYAVQANLVHLVLVACDHIKRSLAMIRTTKDDTIPVERLLEAFEKAYANEPFALDWVEEAPATVPLAGATGQGPPEPTEWRTETVRIKTERIEELLALHNELSIQQFQLKKDYEAGKRLAEPFALIERSTLKIQNHLLALMLLPVDLILGPLPAMVEETASKLGKEVDFQILGGDLGLDRMILENLRDPLIHLVRNCLDHGIEPPQERLAAGKPRAGKVTIQCSTDAGTFLLRIKDDGRGLNDGAIRAKARALHPERATEIDALEGPSLIPFLFEPGFSTKSEADELSGRGLGLDIVRHQVEAVKGRVTLSSTPGQGTEFRLSLPLSLSTVSGFFVEIGERRFLLPSHAILEAVIVRPEDVVPLAQRRALRQRDKIIPLHFLGDLMGGRSVERDRPHALVVEHLGEVCALAVDRIVRFVSLVYKPLPPRLSRIKAMQGFVFDENYDLIPILSVSDLIDRFQRSGNLETKKRFTEDSPEYKQILVVDDSFSTREIEKSILEAERYNVETAVDGIEALEMLRSRTFHLVVTDINMPRMDGAILIENIRRDERFKDLPILVVSSEKDVDRRAELKRLGADSFLDKADFDRGHLTAEVRYWLGGRGRK